MSLLTPEPMREVNLFVVDTDLEAVAGALARMRVLQPVEVTPEGWTLDPEWGALAARYLAQRQRLEACLAALQLAPAAGAPPAALCPTRDAAAADPRLEALEAEVAAWRARRDDANRELERLQLSETQIRLLLPLNIPVERLRSLRHQAIAVGVMPAENVARVAEALFQIAFVLVPLEERAGRTLVLAASAGEDAPVLERALKSAFFEAIPLPPEAQGRPAEALAGLRAQAAAALDRQRAGENERRQLAARLGPELRRCQAQAAADQRLAEAMAHFPRHGNIYLIAGWLPAGELAAARRALQQAAGHPVALEVLTPDRNRTDVPSLLRPPRWLRPFSDLVGLFGLSAYNEIDPTLLVAASFFVMYGMMFGDIGHGLLLLGVGLLLRRRWRDAGAWVATAGMSGIGFGLLYGAAFGRPLLHAAWLRPLEGIWTILLTAVLGGVALLNLGFVLNLVNACRARDWPRLLLDKNGLVGMALYWDLLGGGAGVALHRLPAAVLWPLPALAGLLWLHEPLAAWLFHVPAPRLSEALVTGLFETFEALTGYISNSLSFIRLGAFAVAHEGLSVLVLQYAGGRWGWLVLAGGTCLLVGFEGVIVGIQALRLEYYEFFGKFFRGSGLPFAPLALTGDSHAH